MTASPDAALRDRRVLVTGGCGMVGSALVRRLAALGARVTALDDLSAYPFDAVRVFGLDEVAVDLVRGDVADPELVARACRRQDYVVHAAALADVAGCSRDLDADFRANVVGTMNVLRGALRSRPRRVLIVSSASVYGQGSGGLLAEGNPAEPISTYANSKLWGERQALLAHRMHALPVTCVRYFSVYGPPQVPKVGSQSWCVAIFAMRAVLGLPLQVYGEGTQVRDFIYIDDIVTGTLLGLASERAVGATFNLGTGTATTIAEVTDLVRELFGAVAVERAPRRLDDPLGGAADTARMESIIGWLPPTTLEEGVRAYRDWLLATPQAIPDWLLDEAAAAPRVATAVALG